jgi:ABC-2 type transport system ATP-binding protein
VPVLVARGLTRRYGALTCVEGVDLQVEAGEVLGLIGPNGGGKTTLLSLLAGLVRPSEGSVTIDGVEASELAVRSSGAVGLITAEPGLYPLLTGRENLRFFGGLYGRSPEEVDQAAAPLLQELGVAEDLDRLSSTYSSGTRQKVSLVRALLLTPRVLLLDEPTSHLDPVSSRTIHDAVRRRADQGTAVVMATHDLHTAEHVCDRVAAIDRRVVRILTLSGERSPPPTGKLFGLYQEIGR